MSPRAALCALVLACALAAPARAEIHYVIVGGLGGDPEYDLEFARLADTLAEAIGSTPPDPTHVVKLSGEAATRAELEAAVRALGARVAPGDDVAVFLIGHGSYDGDEYKFNLVGPDVTGETLARLLRGLRARRLLVVNTSSSSGASIDSLRADDRLLITATRSGAERSAPVFGRYLVEALTDPEADLDRDGWITAQEVFERATRRVAAYYEREGFLLTEHARIEGPAQEPFGLVRLARARVTEAEVPRREALLAAIERLRERKPELETDAYYRALEDLMVALAELEEAEEARAGERSQEVDPAPATPPGPGPGEIP